MATCRIFSPPIGSLYEMRPRVSAGALVNRLKRCNLAELRNFGVDGAVMRSLREAREPRDSDGSPAWLPRNRVECPNRALRVVSGLRLLRKAHP